MPSYKYQEENSSLFDLIKRPLIELEIYSIKSKKWMSFKRVLADTGADICLLPRFMGNLLVEDMSAGIYKKIRGIVPNTFLNGYIHNFKIKIEGKEFLAPVFIAESEDVTPIFGRANALDLFTACFDGDYTKMTKK